MIPTTYIRKTILLYSLHDTTSELERFCQIALQCPFVALDTEFIRDKTYYPKLCLLQVAVRSDEISEVALFDTLSPNLNLKPLAKLLAAENTVKVLHAARQDIELLYFELGILPKSVFDTQIAAMVCGFGDQIRYEYLVRDILNIKIQSGSKVTDWSIRPLTEQQLLYAASDVDHLRDVYLALKAKLANSKREAWIVEEMDDLTNIHTYKFNPEDAWLRIRTQNESHEFQSALRELAKFREQVAQDWNLPRQWVITDKLLIKLADSLPSNESELMSLRFINQSKKFNRLSSGILEAIRRSKNNQNAIVENLPIRTRVKERKDTRLLQILLKMKAEEIGIAERLIATGEDLQQIAAGNFNIKPMKGWRKESFGTDAVRLSQGEIALTNIQGKLTIVLTKAQSANCFQEQ